MASARPPLLRRLAPLLHGSHIRASHRPLASSSTSAAASETPSPVVPDSITMTKNCVRKLKELHDKEPSAQGKMLRLSVEAGRCSGFPYAFSLDGKKNAEDRIFERDGFKLVVDNVSYDFVKGATVDYVEELIGSSFLVSMNPSTVRGCGCKSSFMVK